MPADVPTVSVDSLPAGALLLDVREPDEWAAGRIAGALHIPMTELPRRMTEEPAPLAPDTDIVVVCKVGGRSAQVTAWLCRQGYSAANLSGGMLAWEHAGHAMEADGGATPRVV
ncbi:MAG TPA: rhodanese-like domain-containing protein [Jatrophihabitans sp.]|jgi:rhodanese-related sulfurtransferase|uniref:rhodanese-like domain-containing protein n=1 Tax=Jatrophihabitans sp. TaxID=1932789 RepID=UPI002E0335A2|nr:rhodanese-like domain-containing protein [Jatrophihabitans sp.]